MIKVELVTSTGKSEVFIGGKIETVISRFEKRKTVVMADENLLRFHPSKFDGFPVISIGSGEVAKSMDQAILLYHKLLKMEVDRTWSLIGAGGGIATDLSGFVASTFLRGISFGFVSTTLLGQVDAAIGGKNGVNLDGYKNMVGLIRQPEFVFCDVESLSTLPDKDFVGGFAEIIKYGAIRDRKFLTYLDKHLEKGLSKDSRVLETMIYESVKNKIEVVRNDENELGERKTLNFGHTFAHAFEKLHKMSHGEAVALGMVLAARLSVNLGLLDALKADELANLIKRCGLPVHLEYDPDSLAEIMKKDKKRAGQEISFILLQDLGKALIKKIAVKDLKSILYDLR
jgi:3-dehydroquinate synthase